MQVSVPRSNLMGATARLRLSGGLAAAVVAGALLLGACGSSTPSGSGATTTTTSSGGSTTPTTASGGSTTTTASGGVSSISGLANALSAGGAVTYDATYKVTTSSGTDTITFAAQPPSSFAYSGTTSSGGKEDYFSNGTASYACSENSGSSQWQCVNLGSSGLGAYAGIADLYEGKYWLGLVNDEKAYASLAGFHFTSSSMTVNGIALQCGTWTGGPNNQSGEVCVTSQGILGYVKSASSTFEIQSFSSSVPSGTFSVPAGATTITMPAGA
jgi:hypothetical protein